MIISIYIYQSLLHNQSKYVGYQPYKFGFGNVGVCNIYWSNGLGNVSLLVIVKPPVFVLVIINAT